MIQVAALWSQWKNVVFIGALAVSFMAGWEMKSRSVVKQFAKQETAQVKTEQKRGTQAVKQAATDQTRLNELEKQNEDLLKRLEAVDRVQCKPSADELRFLEDIANSTKR